MKTGDPRKVFSGKLHPGFWVVGISLLTMNIYRALQFIKVRSLFVPFIVGGTLGSILCIYTLLHRRQMRKLQKADALVRRSELKYRSFFENSTDAMLIIEEGEFVDCNEAAVAMLGYDGKKEILHTHPSKLSPEVQPDGRSSAEKADEMMQLAQEQGGYRFEWEHLRKDGSVFPVEVSLAAIPGDGGTRLHTVWRDLTQRKQAEKERERLVLAIEQSAEIIMVTDADANIQYVNPTFEKITGYTCSEVLGENPRFLQSKKASSEFYEKMWETLTCGEAWSGRLINKKKDGTIYIEEASISPVKDHLGIVVGYVAAKRDITYEQELETQLRQAQKMEAVGQMAGGIAHDFNNLLQIIGGYAELSRASTDPESFLGTSLKQIDDAAQRGKTLVRQILAFSRRQVIDPVDLDLNVACESLLQMIRGLIGEHIKLEMIPEPHLGIVHVDRGLMEQVLVNLCVNARDAMPEGGTLTLETKTVLMDSEYAQTHAWATEGHYVLMCISDTGCGMGEETLARVFEPFFTTKEVGKGTGLGLSMVHGIVEQHNGHISVYSEVGHGSVFKIYLPMVEHQTGEVAREVLGSVTGGTETVLVAEDDEAVLELAEVALHTAGYAVLTAKNGEEAIQVFEEHAGEIDMLMFDVVMPRMGGKEAMEHILKAHPDLPHLFASGYSENAVHTNFIKNRGLHLLSKPYQTDALLRKVREVLDEK